LRLDVAALNAWAMLMLPEPQPELLADAALFLDFDGTLVELAQTPDAIEVPRRLGPLLIRLNDRLNGRLAIISGRALDDLERHAPATDVAFSGSHGLETQLADGTRLPLAVPESIEAAQRAIRAFAADRPGLVVEDKPAGVALHFRQAPQASQRVDTFMRDLADRLDLIVQRGAMVVELRASGADKGDAVRSFMATPPFQGARPVFVGDDLTDEHAFQAAADLGGDGVLVGPMRDTAARYRLPSVVAVAAWLEQAA
jgi:trehalose 6-phosphate phosphatase